MRRLNTDNSETKRKQAPRLKHGARLRGEPQDSGQSEERSPLLNTVPVEAGKHDKSAWRDKDPTPTLQLMVRKYQPCQTYFFIDNAYKKVQILELQSDLNSSEKMHTSSLHANHGAPIMNFWWKLNVRHRKLYYIILYHFQAKNDSAWVLLKHPLAAKLRQMKWKNMKFFLYAFLLYYLIFTVFLTTFTILLFSAGKM